MVREGAAGFDCWCKRTYGSTEYPTLTTGRAGDDPERDATTDGVLIDGAELRIVDPETLADLRRRHAGELLARGPEMFAGYFDDVARRGRVRRGRLVPHRRPRGVRRQYLTIIDRLKDVIIRGGENISARSRVVARHPSGRRGSGVCRRGGPVMGERVSAFVIPRPATA